MVHVDLDLAGGRDWTSYLAATPSLVAKAYREHQETLQRKRAQEIVQKYQFFENDYYLLRLILRAADHKLINQ